MQTFVRFFIDKHMFWWYITHMKRTYVCFIRTEGLPMMRKLFLTLIAVLIFATGFLSHSVLVSMAGEEESSAIRYYKSICIENGDNLWTIADQYRQGSPMSVEEYVKELKQMNNLREDTIHAGQYLTVVYFQEPSLSL